MGLVGPAARDHAVPSPDLERLFPPASLHDPEGRRGVSVQIDAAQLDHEELVRRHQTLHGCGLRHVLDCDPYGISKAEAEAALRALASETGMEVVVIRPPLVYGPGVKANFLRMATALARGVPLPLGAIEHNRRSLVALDNLVDLITTCMDHPAAANQTFLVSDGEDLSTTALLRRTAAALGVRARLLPVPGGLLMTGAALLGRRGVAQRLC